MKRRKKVFIILSVIIVLLISFWGVVLLLPVTKIEGNNIYLKEDRVYISAHRGGGILNPENTEKAFDYVINDTSYTDFIEIDVHATKDDVLVINHDKTINRTSLSKEENKYPITIKDNEYKDLLKYNVAKNFVSKDGTMPYYNLLLEEAKENGLTLMKFDDFLTKYNNKREFKLLLEIKQNQNEALRIARLIKELYDKEENAWWINHTIVISFSQNVLDYFEKNTSLNTCPLGDSALFTPILSKFGLENLVQSKYEIVQVMAKPTYGIFSVTLATKRLVSYLHKRNQAVLFWTINDEKYMKELIELGADIITTDDPELLNKLNEQQKKQSSIMGELCF